MTEPGDAQKLRHIVQGKVGVSGASDIVFTTILGSSILVCIHDSVACVGGVAHFLFPEGEGDAIEDTRFGGPALVSLLQKLQSLGTGHGQFVAHVFGGARVYNGGQNIGQRNIDYALHFLEKEGINIAERGLGGEEVRRVRFTPTTGQVVQTALNDGFSEGGLGALGSNS